MCTILLGNPSPQHGKKYAEGMFLWYCWESAWVKGVYAWAVSDAIYWMLAKIRRLGEIHLRCVPVFRVAVCRQARQIICQRLRFAQFLRSQTNFALRPRYLSIVTGKCNQWVMRWYILKCQIPVPIIEEMLRNEKGEERRWGGEEKEGKKVKRKQKTWVWW